MDNDFTLTTKEVSARLRMSARQEAALLARLSKSPCYHIASFFIVDLTECLWVYWQGNGTHSISVNNTDECFQLFKSLISNNDQVLILEEIPGF
jgi:hypothetical protein